MTQTNRSHVLPLIRAAALACTMALAACDIGEAEMVDDQTAYDDNPGCFTWADGSQLSWYNHCDGNVLRIDGCDGPIWAADCGDFGQTCVSPYAGLATCE